MMLIFLFATIEEMRLLQMHPESISCDVTFGTENTKKQLFTLATRDGNNKAFNCGRAYIPNGQAWVFWHCFRHCLKAFWGEPITNCMSLMCTDGDVQEYQTFIKNKGEGQRFPNAVHTLCYFPTATLSFNNNVSFPKGTGKEAMHEAIEVPLEKMWLNFERLYMCTMDLRTTSIIETTAEGEGARERMGAGERWSKMPIAQHITEYCLKEAEEQWDSSTGLIVVHAKINPGEWWIFKQHNPAGGVLAPPDYTRLRRVKLVNNKFLWCSCGLPSRLKYPCRHIYAVTEQVSMSMFAVRWHSKFQHYYGRDGAEDWTDVFDVMLAGEFERDHSNGE